LTANGFLTSTPDTRYGTSVIGQTLNRFTGQKFTCGGSGAQVITEIGNWGSGDGTNQGKFHLAIFTDDSANGCPEDTVSHSDSGEILSPTETTVVKNNFLYEELPELIGGDNYWLIRAHGDSNKFQADFSNSTGDNTAYISGTYPTYPTGASWHTHNHGTALLGVYAVYEAAGKSWSGSGALTESGALSRTANLGRSYGGAV
jgi:hypothetical protein